MTNAPKRSSLVKRGSIKETVRNALWARTAGRCTICNRRLLGDSRTYLHSVLLAELAHNIGASDGPDSPRRAQNDGVVETEAEENLLLLCHDCHRIIDHPDHVELFPPDKLRELKESFEARIEMVTQNGGLTRTAALRIGSKIRGSLAMASQREVAEALLRANYLGLVETQRSGDFTCRIHGSAGGRGYWESGQQSIDDTLKLVHQAIENGDVEDISVFAIAPVPLLVYLGWHLDDKTPTRLYQKSRNPAIGWTWPNGEPPVEFGVAVVEGRTEGEHARNSEDVVIVCAVTSPVDKTLLPPELHGSPVVEVGPVSTPPNPLIMTNEESLANFASTWRSALAAAESNFPKAKRWHLVASAPVTVAIETGRALMRDAHPSVVVYERIAESAYVGVLDIN